MKLNIDFDELIDAFEKSNIMSHYFIDTKEHELIYINEEIEASHLSLLVEPREFHYVSETNETQSLNQAKEYFEREYIHQVLIKHSWDLSRAASVLKVEKEDLRQKIKDLTITFLG